MNSTHAICCFYIYIGRIMNRFGDFTIIAKHENANACTKADPIKRLARDRRRVPLFSIRTFRRNRRPRLRRCAECVYLHRKTTTTTCPYLRNHRFFLFHSVLGSVGYKEIR